MTALLFIGCVIVAYLLYVLIRAQLLDDTLDPPNIAQPSATAPPKARRATLRYMPPISMWVACNGNEIFPPVIHRDGYPYQPTEAEQLEFDLLEAVEGEECERAAELRDQLQQLTNQ